MSILIDTWEAEAPTWDDNPTVREFSDLAWSSLLEAVDPDGLRILDFGCGTGLLTEKLAPRAHSVVALDPSASMIEALSKKRLRNVMTINAQLDTGTAHVAHKILGLFDLIVASSALAFVEDYPATVAVLEEMLKPGGVFLQWDWLSDEESERFGLSVQEIEATLRATGFTECKTSTPFTLEGADGPMPVIMASARVA